MFEGVRSPSCELGFNSSAVHSTGGLTNSYRPDGLRHQRSDNSGTTQILWDGDEPLAQVDTLGNLQRYWSRAGAPATGSWMAHWSRLVKARLPGNPYPDQYLHADAQGTILAVSGSNGAALTHNQPPPRVGGWTVEAR